MTLTDHTLADVPRDISWSDLSDFAKHLPADSACSREIDSDFASWNCRWKTNAILADIFDAIQWLSYGFVKAHSKVSPKKPKAYPRPHAKSNDIRYGKDAIPRDQFEKWWNSFDPKKKGDDD
jgi:hypothetical protein